MELINRVLIPVLAIGGISLFFGILLAVASKVFAVKQDERITQIRQLLPGANCGGCGYAGCDALAQAIASGNAPPRACSATAQEDYKKICLIMGLQEEQRIPLHAVIRCAGSNEQAVQRYQYEGLSDCYSAQRLSGGNKVCAYGCLGLGSCAKVCPHQAIILTNGVASVDSDRCVGCGACIAACPRKLIELVPVTQKYAVLCNSPDKGTRIKEYCETGCVGCKICEKNCMTGAITVRGCVAHIDYTMCTNCGTCIEKCPRKIIINQKH